MKNQLNILNIDFSNKVILPQNAKQYKTIDEVWSDLDKGKTIYWASIAYKLHKEEANCDFQKNHFTCKNNIVLSARHIETYWGGLLHEAELSDLFSISES